MLTRNWDSPGSARFPPTDWEKESETRGWTPLASANKPPTKFNFLVNHLASFSSAQLLTTNQGMDKLVDLHRDRGIWPISVIMRIDSGNFVVLHNTESKEEIERFPLSRVHHPVAYVQTEREYHLDYNNLLLFSVALENNEEPFRVVVPDLTLHALDPNAPHKWELHVFECIQDPAYDVAKAIQLVKEGLTVPAAAAAAPLGGGVDGFMKAGENENASISSYSSELPPGRGAGVTDKLQLTVELLNACIEEIEMFIQRLDSSVRATQEHQLRQSVRGRAMFQNRMMGEGLLQARRNLPTIVEFVDVLKKVKLCFNCIAAAQRHLEYPNASELVHALFPQLHIITRVCKNLATPTPQSAGDLDAMDLPQRVVSPLLTGAAVQLLRQCLSSSEYDLWNELGDAWMTPIDEWRNFVPPYEPHFYNGFAVDMQLLDWHNSPDESSSSDVDIYNESHRAWTTPPSEAAHPRRLQRQQLLDAQVPWPYSSTDLPITARSIKSDAANYAQIVSPNRGSVSAMAEYSRDFNGHDNMVSTSFVDSSKALASQLASVALDEQTAFIKSVLSRRGLLYRVIRERMAFRPKEISIHLGEVVEVIDNRRQFWRLRNFRGEEGYSLNSCLEPLLSEENGSIANSSRNSERETVIPPAPAAFIPAPPPLPDFKNGAQPTPNRPTPKSNAPPESSKKAMPGRTLQQEQAEAIAEELRRRQRVPTVPQRKFSVKSPKINENSTPEEVSKWLDYKGFSDKIITIFKKYSGKDLFDLTRSQLDLVIPDRDDVARLDSLLTVQKKLSNYATRSSHELKRILQKRKELVQDDNDSVVNVPSAAAVPEPGRSPVERHSSHQPFVNASFPPPPPPQPPMTEDSLYPI